MRKEIKRIGNSAGIILSQEEMKVYSLKVGDVVEIDEFFKVEKGKKKENATLKHTPKKNDLNETLKRMPQ
jgi:antitoxin component of MazEF toxin-antitoxin module